MQYQITRTNLLTKLFNYIRKVKKLNESYTKHIRFLVGNKYLFLYNGGSLTAATLRNFIRHRTQEGATFIGFDASLLIIPGVVPFCW